MAEREREREERDRKRQIKDRFNEKEKTDKKNLTLFNLQQSTCAVIYVYQCVCEFDTNNTIKEPGRWSKNVKKNKNKINERGEMKQY